jgi:hypothetical protein
MKIDQIQPGIEQLVGIDENPIRVNVDKDPSLLGDGDEPVDILAEEGFSHAVEIGEVDRAPEIFQDLVEGVRLHHAGRTGQSAVTGSTAWAFLVAMIGWFSIEESGRHRNTGPAKRKNDLGDQDPPPTLRAVPYVLVEPVGKGGHF